MKCPHCGKVIKKITQNPIKDYKEIARRIMCTLWGGKKWGDGTYKDWDENSGAHNYWKRWAKKNFARLKKMEWHDIYVESRKINKKW